MWTISYLFTDYPDYYSQYANQALDQSNVKYEENEQKYEPDNTNGSSRHYDDYEEGEAY